MGVRAPVAGVLGDQQPALVEHAHEARRPAARGDVSAPVRAGGAQDEEGRAGDEVATVLVEAIDLLAQRGRVIRRGRHHLAQLLLAGHEAAEYGVVHAQDDTGGTSARPAPVVRKPKFTQPSHPPPRDPLSPPGAPHSRARRRPGGRGAGPAGDERGAGAPDHTRAAAHGRGGAAAAAGDPRRRSPSPSRGSAGGARWPWATPRPAGSSAAFASRPRARSSSPGTRSSAGPPTAGGAATARTGWCAWSWRSRASTRPRTPARPGWGSATSAGPRGRRLRPPVRLHRPREPSERPRRRRLLPARGQAGAGAEGRLPDRPGPVPGPGRPLRGQGRRDDLRRPLHGPDRPGGPGAVPLINHDNHLHVRIS